MGYYIKSPFKPPVKLLVPGNPTYLLGSFNDRTGPTLGMIISDSAVTTTATLTFLITSGNAPVSGSLITVIGAANSAGAFNTVNATILTVVIDTSTGITTVTYAIASTTQGTLPDSGQVEIPQPEVAITLLAQASEPAAVSFGSGGVNNGRSLVAIVSMPLFPTTAIVTLQGALQDTDPLYADIATVASVAGGVLTGGSINIADLAYRFYRFNVSGLTGPAASIIAKLED